MNTNELNNLIALYGKDIFSFCVYLTKDQYEAEELYQEVFIKACEVLDKISDDKNAKSFLIGVAIRLWKNKKRKIAWRIRIAPTEKIEGAVEVEDKSIGPEKSLVVSEQKKAVMSAVNELNDKLRIPILMYYSMDISIEKISELLKIPQGTVKSRLYNAKKILKQKLEADIYG